MGCYMRWPRAALVLALCAAPMVQANTFYLTVAGLGGEPEYEQRFTGWARDVDKLLKAAEPNAKVETLAGPSAVKSQIEAKLRDFAQQSKPDDSVVRSEEHTSELQSR